MKTGREMSFRGEFHLGPLHVSFEPGAARMAPSLADLSLDELRAEREQVLQVLHDLSEEIKRREGD